VANDVELRLMAVHAHPDDESTSTGGILARYGLEGARTIVVTCTNGELGDGPAGAKPGTAGHDTRAVAAIRQAELRAACAHLGVTHLELLGYHDSGMAHWDQRRRPDAFCNIALGVAAQRVAQLIDYHRPQVVVSYDPHGTYQHPDHVHAARVAAWAVQTSGIPAKLYAKAHGTSYWRRFRDALAQIGVEHPGPDPEVLARVEEAITTVIDVAPVVERKRIALHAHASQVNSSLAAKLPPDLFARAFSTETYIRVYDTVGSPSFEDDLFAGLRK